MKKVYTKFHCPIVKGMKIKYKPYFRQEVRQTMEGAFGYKNGVTFVTRRDVNLYSSCLDVVIVKRRFLALRVDVQ